MWLKLEGMYGVVIYDHNKKYFVASRDHVGIIPMYWGIGKYGEVYVASELKVIED